MHQTLATRRGMRGFTLLEAVFTIVVLAIFVKFAMMKIMTPGTLTLPAQAQSVADVVRRAQSLAVIRSQRVRVNVPTSTTVVVECLPVGTSCVTNSTLTLAQDVTVSGSAIAFNSLGVPINSTTGAPLTTVPPLTVSHPTKSFNIIVAPLTGRVSISP